MVMDCESHRAGWPRAFFFCVMIGATAFVLGSVIGGICVIAIGFAAMLLGIVDGRACLREAREQAKRDGDAKGGSR